MDRSYGRGGCSLSEVSGSSTAWCSASADPDTPETTSARSQVFQGRGSLLGVPRVQRAQLAARVDAEQTGASAGRRSRSRSTSNVPCRARGWLLALQIASAVPDVGHNAGWTLHKVNGLDPEKNSNTCARRSWRSQTDVSAQPPAGPFHLDAPIISATWAPSGLYDGEGPRPNRCPHPSGRSAPDPPSGREARARARI